MKSSSLLKLIAQGGGAAAGAKIGTMINPGMGTAIGAGVGYLCGLSFSSEEDNTTNISSFDNNELEKRLRESDKKANKKLERVINSLNTNKGVQDSQSQQQYQASQQQFMLMMMIFSQNQRPALEAGQNLAKQELSEIKQALRLAETKNQELLKKIELFQAEKAKKEEEKENVQTEINQLDQDLADKKIESAEHQQKVTILREREKVAQARIEEILISVTALQNELQTCSNSKDDLLAKKEEVKITLADYQQKINKLAETLNDVANQHDINKQVPIINVNSSKPLQSNIEVSDVSSISDDSNYQGTQGNKTGEDSLKKWFNEAKPYLKWGGISLAIILLLAIIFKFFNYLLRLFY